MCGQAPWIETGDYPRKQRLENMADVVARQILTFPRNSWPLFQRGVKH